MAKQATRGEGFDKKSGLAGLGSEFAKAAFGGGQSPQQSAAPQQPKQLTQMEQELVRGIEEKASKAGMDVNIRIVVSASDELKSKRYLDNIVNAFSQYNLYQYGNTFAAEIPSNQKNIIRDFIYRSFNERRGFVLNTEELASAHCAAAGQFAHGRIAPRTRALSRRRKNSVYETRGSPASFLSHR